MAGGERQRIFWRHNYEGTQGLIFVVDGFDEGKFEIAKKVCIFLLFFFIFLFFLFLFLFFFIFFYFFIFSGIDKCTLRESAKGYRNSDRDK